MLKRTLHFSSAVHLSVRNKQLIIDFKEIKQEAKSIPIEDIGLMIIEHPQVTMTSLVIQEFVNEKAAIITCDSNYMPNGMFLPFNQNSEQTKKFRDQINISEPLKKQLWKQTIHTKIYNQAKVLEHLALPNAKLLHLLSQIQSGDSTNCEGQAASIYWDTLFGNDFFRGRDKKSPNAQLNYGYAILRSIIARALVSSGLHPSMGIFHKNKYNAFCLADDIMEPYRPYVDWIVLNMEGLNDGEDEGLRKEQKIELLKLSQMDVQIGNLVRPLFNAASITSASLHKCYTGDARKIIYPFLDL